MKDDGDGISNSIDDFSHHIRINKIQNRKFHPTAEQYIEQSLSRFWLENMERIPNWYTTWQIRGERSLLWGSGGQYYSELTVFKCRYDLTVPFARYCAMNKISNIKRYHMAKVWPVCQSNIWVNKLLISGVQKRQPKYIARSPEGVLSMWLRHRWRIWCNDSWCRVRQDC